MRNALIYISVLAASIIPASAQISADEAMRICRNQVRQDASARFGWSSINFRNTNLNEHEGVRDRIEGTFALSRGQGPEMHTFACSVDLAAGNLRWARIDSENAVNSSGSAERAAYTDAEVMDLCRDLVRGRIEDHGYTDAEFNSIGIDKTRGGSDLVNGRATGDTGGHQNVFDFSCQVNRATGAVGSVELSAH